MGLPSDDLPFIRSYLHPSWAHTISIALVVPPRPAEPAASLMQAFSYLLAPFCLEILLLAIGVMAALRATATLTTWMMGPARGLSVTAQLCGSAAGILSQEHASGPGQDTHNSIGLWLGLQHASPTSTFHQRILLNAPDNDDADPINSIFNALYLGHQAELFPKRQA
jgi:hypothetical protein